jgi:G3E family GTPase
MDDEVAMHYMLDAVITVVDARHAMQQLDEHEEAQRQVGFADRLLLSKTDLADAGEVEQLRARLKRMNPRAPIGKADFGQVPISEVLDLRGFNLNDKLELDPEFLAEEEHEHHECGEHCGHDHHHAHHSDEIAAFVFKSDRPFDTARLDEFLGSLVQVFGPRMLRYKGVLWMQGADRKVVFQGVHQTMGTDIGTKWPEGEPRGSKMVFIGKNLPKETFIQGLEQCLV